MSVGIIVYDENHNELIGGATRPIGYKALGSLFNGITYPDWEYSPDGQSVIVKTESDFSGRTDSTAWITFCQTSGGVTGYLFDASVSSASDSDFPDIYFPEVYLEDKKFCGKLPATVADILVPRHDRTIKKIIMNVDVLWGAF